MSTLPSLSSENAELSAIVDAGERGSPVVPLSGGVRGTVVAINASILNSGLMAVTLIAGRFLDQTGVEPLIGALLVLQLIGVGLMLLLPRTASGSADGAPGDRH